jgi:hypothetical protein
MGALFSDYLFNSGFELITLAVVLFTLSKLVVESLSSASNIGKRIPPEKASLCGQRLARRVWSTPC